MKYLEEIRKSTQFLANDPRIIFIGQSVSYPGNAIFSGDLKDIPSEKKIEMPVFEETQMGLSIGLALEGFVPVSVFPRHDFLMVAMSQLVNHLDKIAQISQGELKPKVIIRTVVGSVRPLDPGVQHKANHTEALRQILKNVDVVDLAEPEMIFPAYKHALERTDGKSTILVEYGDFYNEK